MVYQNENENTGRFCRCHECGGKRYLISTRDDGRRAVERCDVSDEDAAIWAIGDGVECSTVYPCIVMVPPS